MTDKHNHCIIAHSLTVCSDPSEHCLYFKAGYEDCFYHKDQRCCHARAIMSFAEAVIMKKVEKQTEGVVEQRKDAEHGSE